MRKHSNPVWFIFHHALLYKVSIKFLFSYLPLSSLLIFFFCAFAFWSCLKQTSVQISSIRYQAHNQKLHYVYLPSIDIHLPLTKSLLQNGEWTISEKKTAFFGETSSLPGDPGITLVFAHAREGLFSHLPLLKKGDTIVIGSGDTTYTYKVANKKVVAPDDMSFMKVKNTKKNTLVILTCIGKADEKRIIFFAPLVSESYNKV